MIFSSQNLGLRTGDRLVEVEKQRHVAVHSVFGLQNSVEKNRVDQKIEFY
jgi:hypothetical protein